MNTKYGQLSKKEMRLVINQLQTKEGIWKIVAGLIIISTVTSFIVGIGFVLKQLGDFYLGSLSGKITKLSASQHLMSQVVTALAFLCIVLWALVACHKKLVAELSWLKKQVNNLDG
ncbi:hypothetical protein PT274_03530 [Leuconostocaceae bacterium ESL0958]|nr:hypothetical protein [Leuconostocaceae bacterium ESL0958]